MAKGSGTRSGLLWEVERLLDECQELPQILLMENVPEVIGEKNIMHFQDWEYKLRTLGYSNYVEILNAKDYGIPQNRRRCFMISILGEYNYNFPKPIPLKLRLKDMLEDEVDEKYYLTEKQIQDISNWNAYQKPLENIKSGDDICPTITTRSSAYAAGMILIKDKNQRIRRLISCENWRLMGFKDTDYEKARKVNSNEYLNKQAGNSIVVNVLEAIFKQLL